jgi:hypothetical protein
VHAIIERRGDEWTVKDNRTASGTYVNGRRVAEACKLQRGDRIWICDWEIVVLDEAYLAAPGEFTPRIHRLLVVECEQLLFRAELWLESRTANAELERMLVTLMNDVGGRVEGDRVRCVDPVDAVLGMRGLCSALEAGPVAGVHIDVTLRRLFAGAAALELLAEPGAPAREAWAWIDRHGGGLPRFGNLRARGLAVMHYWGSERGLPAELAGEARLEGPGLLAWLEQGEAGVLLWIDRGVRIGDAADDDIRISGSSDRVRARIVPGAGGWLADTEPVPVASAPRWSGLPLAAGTVLDLGRARFEVIAVR